VRHSEPIRDARTMTRGDAVAVCERVGRLELEDDGLREGADREATAYLYCSRGHDILPREAKTSRGCRRSRDRCDRRSGRRSAQYPGSRVVSGHRRNRENRWRIARVLTRQGSRQKMKSISFWETPIQIRPA